MVFLPPCAAGVNVGLRRPANQSTTVRGGDAGNGNDGDLGTEHDGKRCTETQSEPSPWWRVDLLKPYSVKVVRVTTRGCCGEWALLFHSRFAERGSPYTYYTPSCLTFTFSFAYISIFLLMLCTFDFSSKIVTVRSKFIR